MTIPTPVPQQDLEEDKSAEYLQEWKRLFESVHKNIKVVLYTDDTFKQVLDSLYEDIEFEYRYYQARIAVHLPDQYNLRYLVGLINDRMFSDREVSADPLLGEYPCEPEKKKWNDFYSELCEISSCIRKQIPPPPQLP